MPDEPEPEEASSGGISGVMPDELELEEPASGGISGVMPDELELEELLDSGGLFVVPEELELEVSVVVPEELLLDASVTGLVGLTVVLGREVLLLPLSQALKVAAKQPIAAKLDQVIGDLLIGIF